jgi:hypothetical protein
MLVRLGTKKKVGWEKDAWQYCQQVNGPQDKATGYRLALEIGNRLLLISGFFPFWGNGKLKRGKSIVACDFFSRIHFRSFCPPDIVTISRYFECRFDDSIHFQSLSTHTQVIVWPPIA